MSTRKVPAGGHLPALDGIRGLAILLVVFGHAGFIPDMAGLVGVMVFFALSGYLITGRLLSPDNTLPTFYAARAARLVPALVTMVVGVGVLYVISGHAITRYLGEAVTTLLYVENFFGAHVLGHTWSLCVEEQFYLLWPLVLPLLMRVRPRRRVVFLGAAIAISVILRFALADTGSLLFAWSSLPTNAFALLLGCGVAVGPQIRRVPPSVALGAGLAIVTGCVAIGAHLPGVFSVLAAAGGAALIIGARQGNVAFELAPLRFIGRISYAWYLWHWPIFVLTHQVHGRFGSLGAIAASFAAACASTLLIEEPTRRWARRQIRARRKVDAGMPSDVVSPTAVQQNVAAAPAGDR